MKKIVPMTEIIAMTSIIILASVTVGGQQMLRQQNAYAAAARSTSQSHYLEICLGGKIVGVTKASILGKVQTADL